MATLLLEALFLGCGLFAALTMRNLVREWIIAFRRLRGELRTCPATQDVYVTIIDIAVIQGGRVVSADFTRRPALPALSRGLRAAA